MNIQSVTDNTLPSTNQKINDNCILNELNYLNDTLKLYFSKNNDSIDCTIKRMMRSCLASVQQGLARDFSDSSGDAELIYPFYSVFWKDYILGGVKKTQL